MHPRGGHFSHFSHISHISHISHFNDARFLVVASHPQPSSHTIMAPLNVLMVDLYTTGFVGGGMSGSDKKVGVVGLTLFDLRRRGKVGKLSMVGTSGSKFPAIRTR